MFRQLNSNIPNPASHTITPPPTSGLSPASWPPTFVMHAQSLAFLSSLLPHPRLLCCLPCVLVYLCWPLILFRAEKKSKLLLPPPLLLPKKYLVICATASKAKGKWPLCKERCNRGRLGGWTKGQRHRQLLLYSPPGQSTRFELSGIKQT